MSELKAKHVVDVYDAYSFNPYNAAQVYLKSEADKVIAEKDAEIERLEILCANYRHDCDNLAISNEQAKGAARTLLKKMNYNKYKRCLAMAKWCDETMMSCELRSYGVHRIWANKHQWAMRWKYRWLEIAEKFKEAK